MIKFLRELRKANPPLFFYGWLCVAGAVICLILMQSSALEVGGLPAALKPLKFFLSIWIAVWTLGWIVSHLKSDWTRRHYTVSTIIAMTVELVIICGQAMRGRMSHFNVSTAEDQRLFYIMGIAITAFTIWTAVIAVKFFRPLRKPLPRTLLWGIRLGLIAFVLFGFEGGVMGGLLSHSVGGPDNAGGWPIVHWNTAYGDLRIAHFFGLHSLQVLPLFGYFFQRKPSIFWASGLLYLAAAIGLLIRALMGLPPGWSLM